VENHPQRCPLPPRDGRDAVAHPDAVVAVLASVWPLPRGEDDERAARRLQHVRAALGARALLHQHELAAVVVDARLGQDREDLEREVDVAIEVLVQRVPVALAVAQDQWRGPLLADNAAALEQLFVRERKADGVTRLRPAAGR